MQVFCQMNILPFPPALNFTFETNPFDAHASLDLAFEASSLNIDALRTQRTPTHSRDSFQIDPALPRALITLPPLLIHQFVLHLQRSHFMGREGVTSASSKKENDHTCNDCADDHLTWVRDAEPGIYLSWQLLEDEIASKEGANSM